MIMQDKNKLYSNFLGKLIDEKLMCNDDNISIKEIHPIIQDGQIMHHHIVTVERTNKKYLIRTIKEKDYSCSVMNYLVSLNNMSNRVIFPHALTSPFVIGDHTYIVTSYIEGENLESQIKTLSNEELVDLSYKIEENLKLIHSVTNDKYSDGIHPVNVSFGEIMYDKIFKQFHDKHNIFAKEIDVNKLLDTVNSILSQSSFSKPTLVHMDLKPANIIISSQKEVHLIDFELSRFADLDYEWTNLLIKLVHAYDDKFKQYILNPIIEKNFLSLDKAILIDKYKVYLLYLSINKFIYCFKHVTPCPKTIIDLANYLIKQLV